MDDRPDPSPAEDEDIPSVEAYESTPAADGAPASRPEPPYPSDADWSRNPVVVGPHPAKGRSFAGSSCLFAVTAVVVATLFGALGGVLGVMWFDRSDTTQIRVVGSTTEEPVAAAAAAAVPSVVNLDVKGSTETTGDSGLPKGHPSVPMLGQGSGVAYKKAPSGGTYILTNEHVITDAETVFVTLPDGERVKATVVGGDPETDIGVVRVPKTLPLIGRGDSEKLVVGQLVVAIGSPFGLQHSVSSGIVSALHRALPNSGNADTPGTYPLVDVIQTDAAINPGNSGGALVDRTGRLVGINSAIYSDSGENAGIGFAIPSKTALRVADELVATGKVTHPYIGVVGQTVDEALAKQEKLKVTSGAFVVEVTKDLGAQKGGVRERDVIVALDGQPVRSMDDLILLVRRVKVGQTVKLDVDRAGRKLALTVRVSDKPANP